MSRATRATGALLVGLLLLAGAVSAEGGVVWGHVYNGTAGAAGSLGGLPVRLYVFAGDTLKDTLRATTDAQGMFRFEGVPGSSGSLAVAVVEYAGVQYESAMLDLSAAPECNGDIAVYETTTDDSALQLAHSHLIVEMGAGQLEVAEVLTLENNGDRTYVGAGEVVPNRRATAQVPLPVGATDVAFSLQEVAEAMVRTGQGFVDTRPISPGRHQYRLSYVLPCKDTSYSLVKPVLYPLAAVDILIAAPGAEVEAPGLQNLGSREASGVSYVHLGGGSLAPGADVVIRLSGLGQPARTRADRAPSTGALGGAAGGGWRASLAPLLAVVMLAGGLVWHLARAAAPGPAARKLAPAAATEDERGRLLVEVADLDESFAAGDLSEARYRRRRQAAKGRLLELMLGAEDGEREPSPSRRVRRSDRPAGDRPGKEVRASDGARRGRPKPQRG